MKILVTGANGFVGEVLCRKLVERGFEAKGAVRSEDIPLAPGVEKIVAGSIDSSTDWSSALKGIDCVIHLAARVHVMKEESPDPLAEFRHVNTEGTRRLALAVAEHGVKRLVYVSSIKVNGEATKGEPFSEQGAPNPQDPYALSKWEAEQSLLEISRETGLEIVILRPPLVYGPGVGGNFIRMLEWLKKGIPLPLGSVKNRRSMIHVENLADALILCSTHPDAKNETFLVSDSECISTPDLIRMLSEKMGREARIFPFPVPLLHVLGRLTGKSAEIERLTGSLEIDSSKIRQKLGWKPPHSILDGLKDTVLPHRSEDRLICK
ncbi:MAG: SDR family oxidoreductase [Burkholderiales bacterium]|nr:SDR family oxidoreductase [Burkholderiales bacterium]